MTTSDQEVLFDIRIDNDRDGGVVLLKGGVTEAVSVLLSGYIVLSVKEPIRIKSLSLKLSGKMKLKLPSERQEHSRYYRKIFYEHEWTSFDIHGFATGAYNTVGSNGTHIHDDDHNNIAVRSLKGTGPKSSTSLHKMNFDHTNNKYFTLIKGTYEFPFNVILPGTLPESVEGLPGALITYNLIASLQRLNPGATMMCQKHLRIVRTLSSDAIELSESVLFNNTWPKKVEYSISVPTKAIAIGSTVPIRILLVPLLKGLKLGPIRISLIEKYHYGTKPNEKLVEGERKVTEIKIKDPINEIKLSNDPTIVDSAFKDSWDLEALLKIPSDLLKCTHDCYALECIKSRHQIRLVASLINPDNHISELRATLSVQLYISPYIELSTKPYSSLYVTLEGDENKPRREHKWSATPFNKTDRLIFPNTNDNNVVDRRKLAQNRTMNGLMVPPNYEMHIYDKLCHDTPLNESTVNSPIEATNESVLSNEDSLNKLDGSLRGLSIDNSKPDYYSKLHDRSLPSSSGDYFSIDAIQEDVEPDCKSLPYGSPQYIPVFTNHDSDIARYAPDLTEDFYTKIKTPSRVPSYDMAVLSSTIDEELPPKYCNPPSLSPNIEKIRLTKSFTHERPTANQARQILRNTAVDSPESTSPTLFSKNTSPLSKSPLAQSEFSTLSIHLNNGRSRSRTLNSVGNQQYRNSISPNSQQSRGRSISFVGLRNILGKR
ncbi:hypothetical protein RNJ44_04215 [Nakaseomyces bracarensis]|uniref:Arrestin C-terminal-like domain-containing protein n=1 Tax=Nakaseomyces bracarensis TaxID=273131 RepID=A0ABR4NU96_9SACH